MQCIYEQQHLAQRLRNQTESRPKTDFIVLYDGYC
jgi:hypothetical protein